MTGLQVYDEQLDFILGEDGNFTEKAVFDPNGQNLEIYGIYDDVSFMLNSPKDSAGNKTKNAKAIFVVKDAPTFSVYEEKKLYLVNRDKTFTVLYIENDVNGVQQLWLT